MLLCMSLHFLTYLSFTRPDKINNIAMPAKKNTNNNKRPKASKPRLASVMPRVSVIPANMHVRLTYYNSTQLGETVVGAGANYFYRLNSVYDPDASGVGSVAIGYNTYAGLFLNYKVHRVTVRFDGFVGGGTGVSSYGNVTMAPVPGQAVVPTNRNTWKVIPGNVCASVTGAQNGGKNHFSFTRSYDLAKVLQVSRSQYNNEMDFSGAIGSNPARQAYLMVAIDGAGSSSVVQMTYNISLTYDVEWFNPTPLQ